MKGAFAEPDLCLSQEKQHTSVCNYKLFSSAYPALTLFENSGVFIRRTFPFCRHVKYVISQFTNRCSCFLLTYFPFSVLHCWCCILPYLDINWIPLCYSTSSADANRLEHIHRSFQLAVTIIAPHALYIYANTAELLKYHTLRDMSYRSGLDTIVLGNGM